MTGVAVVLLAEERLKGGPGVKLEPPRGVVPRPLVLLAGLNTVGRKKDVRGGSLAGSRSIGALSLTRSMSYQRKEMHKKAGNCSCEDVDRSSCSDRRGSQVTIEIIEVLFCSFESELMIAAKMMLLALEFLDLILNV